MTVHGSFASELLPGVLVVSEPSGIKDIKADGVAGVVWQRHPLASFQNWIDTLDPLVLSRARIVLRPEAVRSAVAATCDKAGPPDGPERERLLDDIAALAEMFANVTGSRWLRLRLDIVATNACRRFHVDRISARLICTYRGTGTQYGTTEDGDPEVIHTVATGAPFVMRGTLWKPSPDPGLVHRSPPIEGTGETRLMLVLDPVDDPDEDL
ncbi:Protein of unknown function [Tranquillimonas rosea]|uniref:DUF1826 domain-containing protein n=1 Tax=Tranquillimonas rosea TaxID=641238 RepID=A0A1H9SWE3_9RHOB|nr:DUF1826 domain-containing protein [Tranquillimonas rosea]SER88709.1 Protein of unknown function [Tranquillimonas rosea]